MKVPQTSLETYRMVSKDMKQQHYGKILFAMRLLGIASSYEAIAKKAGLNKDQIGRRLSELVVEGLIHIDGKGLSSSGRPLSLYSLTYHGKSKAECQKEVEAKNTALKCATNDLPQKRVFTQQPLF